MSYPGSRSWFQKCPQGAKWRTLSNGQIEVEGYGVPLAETTGYFQDARFIEPIWRDWSPYIIKYGSKHRVPFTWIVAVLDIENRGKSTPMNSAGAGGIMALLQSTADMMLGRKANIMDPDDAFDAGVGYMRKLMDTYGPELPMVAAGFNAGSPKCGDTRCKSTIDGAWTFDGTTASGPMGFVEDCTQGRSSQYSYRAVQVNNLAIKMGVGTGGIGADWRLLAALAVAGYFFYSEGEERWSEVMLGFTPWGD